MSQVSGRWPWDQLCLVGIGQAVDLTLVPLVQKAQVGKHPFDTEQHSAFLSYEGAGERYDEVRRLSEVFYAIAFALVHPPLALERAARGVPCGADLKADTS